MKKVFKSKCNSDKNILSKIIVLTIVLIGLVTFFLITKFNKNMNKNLIEFGESEINRITYRFITDKINNEVLNKTSINDILVITKNKDEILYVDFNLDKAYKVLDNVSDILTSSLDKLEMGDVDVLYLDKDLSHKVNGLILNIPMGSVLNSGYFYNLGPKIPVKINFIGSVLTNLNTKITDYGLNNALVEIFVYIEFNTNIIGPFKNKNIKLKYEAIIASMMIEGEVPSFYNGVIEKQSSIYKKSLN